MQLAAAYRPFESAPSAPVAGVVGSGLAPLLRLLGSLGIGVLLLVGLLIGLLLITSGCGPPS
jgi:hypothetical protein